MKQLYQDEQLQQLRPLVIPHKHSVNPSRDSLQALCAHCIKHTQNQIKVKEEGRAARGETERRNLRKLLEDAEGES